MSGDNPTEKKRARQAERLAALSVKTTTPANEDDDEQTPDMGFVDRNCLYSPASLRRVMGIGIRYYNTLIAAGLPRRLIGGRYWFSGRLVLEFMETDVINEAKPAGATGQ